ncbi:MULTISPECIES: triphosphoribosyl-dephospho-CoA synthase CitG [Aerococcus]|uniref:Probable 2-(5''-triphosphoribosyl)-3'-dephosphocoenzyme-A synthase n=1 Tax=Aerococcus sanguinicola TaxID=119206 RepID=A0A5N1GMX3_9LACT|nr:MULTISPECIES: triphosphoribosyl-dephospho-CoA synthase CitG [Aerococcus]KAA9301666.1 triphosphoribosyl-dephospho-CoA synthase CitG [Aerococcus sanguinicola]MDK6368922.1 triphosphoribosyl-dephospho-CoA synthase CitG [Aerococcus sp. UMB9870]MDK6680260.1 triphosphoribosyl-dephospho-CoA synthase CitG [Aerococcus sp. UMB8608]MDK6687265.1 triphosphoribosyl-dephospho-CoA synthase CitG [Aerococcus sp. UMB8623]MDK6940362.1 triphosphoribosyl-dephospho-CoA synthase CitG [Aerococcus sp. UMB8487]
MAGKDRLVQYCRTESQKGGKTLSQIVYEGLKMVILDGTIPVGERINEKLYADSLNISRTPIREALRRTEEEGLVEYIPQHGYIVKNIKPEDIAEIYQLRKSLDTIATINAAKRMGDQEFAELEAILNRGEAAYSGASLEGLTSSWKGFNEYIYAHAQMPRLQSIVSTLYEYLSRFRALSINDRQRRRAALDDHWVIYQYMKEQRFDKLEEVISKHLSVSEKHIRLAVERESQQTNAKTTGAADDLVLEEGLKPSLAQSKAIKSKDETLLLAQFAEQGVLREVMLWPKPGLVDPRNNGAHDDMTPRLFVESSTALFPYFIQAAQLGYDDQSPKTLFQALRQAGIEAEKDMFQATAGVNTHKGIVFSMGIFLAATTAVIVTHGDIDLVKAADLKKEKSLGYTDDKRKVMASIQTMIQNMTQGLISKDWAKLDQKDHLTHGERMFLDYGIKGIRQEAEAGYPTLIMAGLDFLEAMRSIHPRTAEHRLLLYLMARVEDTNVLKRGGIEGYHWLRLTSRQLLDRDLSDHELIQELKAFNQACIYYNVSPGGAADLVAVALYLEKLMARIIFK